MSAAAAFLAASDPVTSTRLPSEVIRRNSTEIRYVMRALITDIVEDDLGSASAIEKNSELERRVNRRPQQRRETKPPSARPQAASAKAILLFELNIATIPTLLRFGAIADGLLRNG